MGGIWNMINRTKTRNDTRLMETYLVRLVALGPGPVSYGSIHFDTLNGIGAQGPRLPSRISLQSMVEKPSEHCPGRSPSLQFSSLRALRDSAAKEIGTTESRRARSEGLVLSYTPIDSS